MKTRLTSGLILALTLGSITLSNGTQASMQIQAINAPSQSVSENELDLQAQITQNISEMLANVPNKVEKTHINQQLAKHALTLQTKDLVKELESHIPNSKLKVRVAD